MASSNELTDRGQFEPGSDDGYLWINEGGERVELYAADAFGAYPMRLTPAEVEWLRDRLSSWLQKNAPTATAGAGSS